MVLLALTLPLLLALGAIVITVGNWYTHARHLQTKVDAAALAGGSAWQLPCSPTPDGDTTEADTLIEEAARLYVGDHTAVRPDGSTAAVTGSFNPQVGGVDESQMYVTLNQTHWWDDGFGNIDFTDPSGSVCRAKVLDVKATEKDTPLLFGVLPFWPDIKRKARVEVKPVSDLRGLLPIAVRFPKPQSAAAVFYDEASGNILGVKYFREDGVFGLPTGLRGYTTLDATDPWSMFQIPGSGRVGVTVALSFRPACDPDAEPAITTNCFEDAGFGTVDQLCRQGSGTVQCFYATGTGDSQSVQSGLHFIRGYDDGANADTDPPALRGTWLSTGSCSNGNGYFNAVTGSCKPILKAQIDLGSFLVPDDDDDDDDAGGGGGMVETRIAGNAEVRFRMVRADGTVLCDYGVECDLRPPDPSATGTVWFDSAWSTTQPQIGAGTRGNSFVIRVRLRNTGPTPALPPQCGSGGFNGNCQWFFNANGRVGEADQDQGAEVLAAPVQRSFMGDTGDHSPVSGPIKFLRLTSATPTGPGGVCVPQALGEEAASQPIGQQRCFIVEMGLRGGVARDQDEPPVAFNLSGTSQSALLDCDPNIEHGQISEEIVAGCQAIPYKAHDFDTTPLCPPHGGVPEWFETPKPPPFDDWAPFECVLTRTQAAAQQMLEGFIERISGSFPTGPCPTDTALFRPGRNYWHDANNDYTDPLTGETDRYTFAQDSPAPARGNRIRADDPRLVKFFMTPYNSFSGQGNETYPVVAFGSFYVTGYGRVTAGGNFQPGWTDPCTGGNGNSSPGAGSKPPPDLDLNSPGSYIWGHFLDNVVPPTDATGGVGLCKEDGTPCVAVLVE